MILKKIKQKQKGKSHSYEINLKLKDLNELEIDIPSEFEKKENKKTITSKSDFAIIKKSELIKELKQRNPDKSPTPSPDTNLQINKNNEKINKLKDNLKQKDTEIVTLQHQNHIEKKNSIIQNQNQKISELKEKIHNLEYEKKEHLEQNQHQQNQITQLQTILDIVKNDNETLKRTNKELTTDNKALEKAYNGMLRNIDFHNSKWFNKIFKNNKVKIEYAKLLKE